MALVQSISVPGQELIRAFPSSVSRAGSTACSVLSYPRSAPFQSTCRELSSFLRSHKCRGHHRSWSQIVSHNHAALHHKFYSLHFGDVLERISGDCDDVGELALFNRAQAVLHVDDLGVNRRCHTQGVYRSRPPFDVKGKHLGLHAMRTVALRVKHPSRWRGGAASKTESHTGSKHFFPRLLHQAKTAVRSKALQVLRLVLAHVQSSCGQRQVFLEEHFYVRIVGSDCVLDI